ncbi:MAG: DUF1015 family protein [Methanomicrobiales archaeon]|nr:DUF1015 family protein [Methanomicrobiales archaeon]
MVAIHPFAAIRPDPAIAQSLAAVPYDVVTTKEARICIEKNPLSFLRISRADVELPGLSPHDPRVYDHARLTFEDLLSNRLLLQDDTPSLYVYRVQSPERTFTGLVGCVEAEDYLSGLIHRHELTQYEKEEDRTRHIDMVNAQTGLVFLVYRDLPNLSASLESLIDTDQTPDCEVKSRNETRHQVYRIRDLQRIREIQARFGEVNALYIADGHHRAAAAVNVALRRQSKGTASPQARRFMAVLFAHHQVMIHGYSRLITDLCDLSVPAFLEQIRREFKLYPHSGDFPSSEGCTGNQSICMYLSGQWYELIPRKRERSSVAALDVMVLQEQILRSILGISDPRRDPRLQYHGGVHSFHDLEQMVDSGTFAVAFAMRPVSIEMVMTIADEKGIMPPKSTWFEPKLLSGLLVHTLD